MEEPRCPELSKRRRPRLTGYWSHKPALATLNCRLNYPWTDLHLHGVLRSLPAIPCKLEDKRLGFLDDETSDLRDVPRSRLLSEVCRQRKLEQDVP